jgi:hypothetical protein
MVECFCGCGRSVSFVYRYANTLGPKVARELEGWQAIQTASQRGTEGSEGVEAFVREGEWLYKHLQAVVHGEPVDDRLPNREVAKWLRLSRRSKADLGRKVLAGAVEQRGSFASHEPDPVLDSDLPPT